ncbi:hypothetical protein G7Y79_00006g019300 [Physcia stellaris]|nr:hypothetical protein G7Y79_00006g019300 [Physcia stellaris]
MLFIVVFFLVLVSSPYVHSISVPSASRLTDDEASWALAVRKGSMLYHELQGGCYPDKVHPLNIDELWAIGFHNGGDKERRWPPTFTARSGFDPELVKFFKWTEKAGAFWSTDIWRTFFTPWKDMTKYHNTYSPLNGLIAALDIRTAAGETVTWADITFALWEAVTAYTKNNIKDLRYIADQGIEDLFTNLIIDRAMDGRSGQHVPLKRFGPGTEAFLALLGTPFGGHAGHLLMQHKRQLGLKTVSEAVVFGDQSPDLVFVLKDMPLPRGGANGTTLHVLVGSRCFGGGEQE